MGLGQATGQATPAWRYVTERRPLGVAIREDERDDKDEHDIPRTSSPLLVTVVSRGA